MGGFRSGTEGRQFDIEWTPVVPIVAAIITSIIGPIVVHYVTTGKIGAGRLAMFARFLVFLGILTIPNWLIIWYVLYVAALNHDRLWEAGFFLALVAQATVAVSLYTFLWGVWLYPKLRLLVKKPERSSQGISARQKDGEEK